jgi:hypothetical protein
MTTAVLVNLMYACTLVPDGPHVRSPAGLQSGWTVSRTVRESAGRWCRAAADRKSGKWCSMTCTVSVSREAAKLWGKLSASSCSTEVL